MTVERAQPQSRRPGTHLPARAPRKYIACCTRSPNTTTALGQRAVAQRRLRRSAADRAAGRRLLCTTNGCATFMSLDASGTLTCPSLRQPASDPGVSHAHALTRKPEPRRPAIRRDAEGVTRLAPTWESLTERLIREAQEAGAFDELPAHGRPLTLDDDPREGDMGLAFHVLRNARTAPPWIEADREVRDSAARIERILERAHEVGASGPVGPITRARFREQLELAIDVHARGVRALEVTAPSVRLHRRRLDDDAVRTRLERALSAHEDEHP